jgi:predicted nucleotidyltransferase
MRDVILNRKNDLAELCHRHRVRVLAVFGSALTDSYEPSRSDLDFAVEFQMMSPADHARAYFALHADLEKLFGTRVDLVEIEAVRNPFVRREIEATQETLYAA